MGRKDQKLRKGLGNKIRSARHTKGITGEQVAVSLDVTRGMIAQWEAGTSFPVPERLIPLLQRLEVSADWLFGIRQKDVSSARQEAYRMLGQLDEDQLPIALRLLSVAGGYSDETE